jgi:RimJ/RimL family protein N-acetyltransferase
VVRLEPLREEHATAIFAAAEKLDWGWFLRPLRTRADVDKRISDGLEAEHRNEAYAFAVLSKKDGQVVGSTSYLQVAAQHKRTEIGSTWYISDAQGTKVNPECKYPLLRHAFEDWGAERVQFTTDANNLRSQRAILKLGAKFEGKLRSDKRRADGSMRDSMVYSIITGEWPAVREGLLTRINGP